MAPAKAAAAAAPTIVDLEETTALSAASLADVTHEPRVVSEMKGIKLATFIKKQGRQVTCQAYNPNHNPNPAPEPYKNS
jgi:hypothetical protein